MVRVGDGIDVREQSRKLVPVQENMAKAEHRGLPSWVQRDINNFSGKILSLPAMDDISLPVQEQLIVELYSK